MTDPFEVPGQTPKNDGSTFNQQPTEISQRYEPQNAPPQTNGAWQPQDSSRQSQFNPADGHNTPSVNGRYQYYDQGGQPPVPAKIPMAARVMAYIVSTGKALPLIGMIIFVIAIVASKDLQADLDTNEEEAQAVAITIIVLSLLGFVLLIGQIVTAAKNSRIGLLVFASIQLAIDVITSFLLFLTLFSAPRDIGAFLIVTFCVLAIGAAQLFVVIATAKSQKSMAAPVIQQSYSQ